VNKSVAEADLRKFATAPLSTDYDIFLSHSSEDAEEISGLRMLLKQEGLSIYVDWIEDSGVDRTNVTAENAEMLRQRMRHCRHLLYATSKAASDSRWMPWELGYFDGARQGSVGTIPLVDAPTTTFKGQEYLGLYPVYQYIAFDDFGQRIGRQTAPGKAKLLLKEVNGQYA